MLSITAQRLCFDKIVVTCTDSDSKEKVTLNITEKRLQFSFDKLVVSDTDTKPMCADRQSAGKNCTYNGTFLNWLPWQLRWAVT